jgi:sugar phosphate isomerase/epimerase
MKLGVFIVLFKDRPLEETLDYVKSKGIDTVEVGSGGYIGTNHCNPKYLLENETELKAFKQAFDSRGMTINCLSCHGNPLHPQKELAQQAHEDYYYTVKLAQKLDIPVVVTFSGCPGDHEGAMYPNWPVSPWPKDFQDILDWQWKEKIIPYWKEAGAHAEAHGIKVALEMHGGFSVHTPATVLRLREAVGDVIGANVDPSHLWWQGMDPVGAIKILGQANAIHFFHAKDTMIDQDNANKYGLTDMQLYSHVQTRSWQFRTVGYGHDLKAWADIFSALRLAGYDGVVSIEHEDGMMSLDEGFTKAINNLQQIVIKEPAFIPLMFAE